MPIRFRCVYCDKLLGIARRKAGAVVNCPQCSQPLIVPTPEPEPEPTAAAAGAPVPPPVPGRLFERDDFEAMLRGDATFRTPSVPPPRKRNRPPKPPPPREYADRDTAPPPVPPAVPLSAPPRPTGMILTPLRLILLLIAVFFLTGLAFGGGILVGRMMVAG
jgi:phage FluMu protein Com